MFSVAPKLLRPVPGLIVCAALAVLASMIQTGEAHFLGRTIFEALVVAILLGAVVRLAWVPGERWKPGIDFASKRLMEVAVMALGATVSAQAIGSGGFLMIGVVAAVVATAIGASYLICRRLGIRHRLGVLIACGNSICGNSAIVAVAPVIGAESGEVAASIAFTALLGVGVVLILPLAVGLLGLSGEQYGVLAGLTVYAVPQVLAATVPVGHLSAQFGTLVKLMRVLMLGPVIVALSLGRGQKLGFNVLRLVPWFVIGFIALAAARSFDLIPTMVLDRLFPVTDALTVVAMAALGLSVDLRQISKAGGRVILAGSISLVVLFTISAVLIKTGVLGG